MKRVFADTGYWVALLNPSDELHSKALEVSRGLGAVRIYTTEMVLVEVANMLGKTGENFRALVQQTIASLRKNPNVTIEPQTSALFRERHSSRIPPIAHTLSNCAVDVTAFSV